MKPQLSTLLAIGLGLAAVGCAQDEPFKFTEGTVTSNLFAEGAYPVMLRDCAFFACHGADDRLFRVWGPKRHRLSETTETGDVELNNIKAEMRQTLNLAVGFINVDDPGNSLLLRKTLDSQAGGTGHLGLDKYGRNVYRSASSPGYVALAKWVYDLSAKAKSGTDGL